MAQRIRVNPERERAANCEQGRLIFELPCNKETIPAKLVLYAVLLYKILQGKLAVETNSQHSTITAIFVTEPSNSWFWSIISDSTATKQIYETRDATFAMDFEGVTYTYRLRTKGAAKQFLVTVQSSPFILMGCLLSTSDGSV